MVLGLASPMAGEAPTPAGEELLVPVAGMQVAIDAKTGRLRQPTAAEAQQLMQGLRGMLKASPRPAVAEVHKNGMLSLVLGDEYLSLYLAKVAPDGAVVQACVDSIDAAEDFLTGAGGAAEDK
jgi:hypothetical protein